MKLSWPGSALSNDIYSQPRLPQESEIPSVLLSPIILAFSQALLYNGLYSSLSLAHKLTLQPKDKPQAEAAGQRGESYTRVMLCLSKACLKCQPGLLVCAHIIAPQPQPHFLFLILQD